MKKFDIDWSSLCSKVIQNNDRIPVRGSEGMMVRVAFDLFRLKNDDKDDLWQVQADDDGNEFLVRTYSMPEDEELKLAKSSWNVQDGKGGDLTITYRNIPIYKMASQNIESPKDLMNFRSFLLRKFALDRAFVVRFLKSLPKNKQNLLKQAGIVDQIKNWLTTNDVSESDKQELERFLNEDVDTKLAKLEYRLSKFSSDGPEFDIEPVTFDIDYEKYQEDPEEIKEDVVDDVLEELKDELDIEPVTFDIDYEKYSKLEQKLNKLGYGGLEGLYTEEEKKDFKIMLNFYLNGEWVKDFYLYLNAEDLKDIKSVLHLKNLHSRYDLEMKYEFVPKDSIKLNKNNEEIYPSGSAESVIDFIEYFEPESKRPIMFRKDVNFDDSNLPKFEDETADLPEDFNPRSVMDEVEDESIDVDFNDITKGYGDKLARLEYKLRNK